MIQIRNFIAKVKFSNPSPNDEKTKHYLRIIVDVDHNYKFLIDSNRLNEDRITNKDKFQIIVDKQSQETIKSFKIDNYDDLFDDLKCLGNQIRIEHFYPLIMKEAENLASQLEKNSNTITNIQDLIYFKRITNLLKMIRYKYNCLITNESLYQIIKLIHSPAKQSIKLTDIVKHFEPININNQQLFDSCLQKLINSRINIIKYDKTIDLNEINNDWNELHSLLIQLDIQNLNTYHIKKLTTFIENLKLMKAYSSYLKANKDLKQEPILKTLLLINKLTSSSDANNSLIQLNNQVCDLFDNKDVINKYFDENKIKLKKTITYEDDPSYKLKYKKETIQELEETIKDLEKNKKDAIPSRRRLIIELCLNYKNYQGNLIERLDKLEKELPQTELTPLLCQELMNFYSSIQVNTTKAVYYYEQLVLSNFKNEFVICRKRVFNFIKALYLNKTPLDDLVKLLSKLKWKDYDQINSYIFNQNLIEFLTDYVYKETKGDEFQNLTDVLIETKFIDRNLMILKLVLNKLIEEKNFKKANEYFKLNLETNGLCVLELSLMRYFVKRLNNANKQQENNKDKDIEIEFGNYLSLLSSVFEWNYIYQLVFLAQIMNGNFKEANITFQNDLNNKLDLVEFRKILDQYKSNSILNRQLRYLLKNIYKFHPINSNLKLKNEIQNILHK